MRVRRCGAHGGGVFGEGGGFVVEGDEASGAEDGLAQPAHAEEENHGSDEELDEVERDAGECGAERGDDGGERGEGGGAAGEGGGPSADAADGEDDSEGFDALDEGGEEGGEDSGRDAGGAGGGDKHHAPLRLR
jgi:hypothetical protein